MLLTGAPIHEGPFFRFPHLCITLTEQSANYLDPTWRGSRFEAGRTNRAGQ
jgi:hypothetical protein